MALISLQNISLAFGGPLIFDDLSLQIEPGERIALLGRNGEGKTTLMKVIAGLVEVDSGEIIQQKGSRFAYLPQGVPQDLEATVFDIVQFGLSDHHDNKEWEIDRVISQMKLNPDSNFQYLSGGEKRRVLLAKALVQNPDILLLDEPTNHLDIESIDWLEDFLKKFRGTLFFVTHDRTFMQHLATRIIELDRGKLFSWSCDYQTFLQRKEDALEVENQQRARFDKKLAQEEIWIRKGIKARRTRNEGRVRALEKLREEKQAQRNVTGKANMTLNESGQSGQIVIRAEGVSHAYENEILFEKFKALILRGDKIGLIGPNGSGKTTLLKILLKQLQPDSGTVKHGTNLDIGYFDQHREQLDETRTVAQNIAEGDGETVIVNGKQRHVMGYLQDFLFTPERARTPIRILSGGERNRLLLAKLFTKSFNFLIMDEPTNDLDIETLELLEDILANYQGTLILVSHDRTFLNNVVTSTLVIGQDKKINEYPGGYDDWKNQTSKPEQDTPQTKPKNTEDRKTQHKERKEWLNLPKKIEKLEQEQENLFKLMSENSFYEQSQAKIDQVNKEAEKLKEKIANAYDRWEELEEIFSN